MKKYLIVLIIITTSCNKGLYARFNYNHSVNPWIDAFKDRVFFSAVREAYQSDTLIFQLIEKKDAFNPYDGLTLKEIEMADEMRKNLIKNMPSPSMCENCAAGSNYFMASGLHYYASRELDSIAGKLYKIHIKNDKDSGLR